MRPNSSLESSTKYHRKLLVSYSEYQAQKCCQFITLSGQTTPKVPGFTVVAKRVDDWLTHTHARTHTHTHTHTQTNHFNCPSLFAYESRHLDGAAQKDHHSHVLGEYISFVEREISGMVAGITNVSLMLLPQSD